MTGAPQTSVSPPADCDVSRCPLCGEPNDCRLSATTDCTGKCWCESVNFPPELLQRVPMEARNRACLCRDCAMTFHREQSATGRLAVVPGDYYIDADGMMVFTATYHLRRGYCCDHDCRHCPYREVK